ncbi:MAG TPA: NADP-dependent oxidoreductase [Steroidobacteraceae bacterium]|nr:NADP-dependent oxidoreductase [Steroidobacteraceae bacterium]
MKAIVQEGIGGPEVLKLESLPVPQPRANQVLVRVYAAAINPLDWRARMGVQRHDQGGPPRGSDKGASLAPRRGRTRSPNGPEPMIPGGDIAGVIAAVGPGVMQWRVGDAVYGRGRHGYAQYVLANGNDIAPKPKRLAFAQAAGIPTADITGLMAVKQAGVAPDQTVVIVGAAGGVGSAALQVAKAQGAKVIAIASSQHNAYLKQLGADEIVNYDKSNPADRIKKADAVINTVDGSAAATLSYVKRGGAIVLPAGVIPRTQCASAGVTCNGMDHARALSTTEALEQINALVDAGKFTVKVERSFPLEQAGQAQELDRAGHAEGKIVVVTTSEATRH